MILNIAAAALMLGGAFFFSVGTLGLIRFPDVRSRLHGLTKADNLGLGLILGGAALWLGDWSVAGLMLLCWLFALAGSSASAHVIAALETDHAEQREPVHHAGEPPTPADDAATAQVPDPEQES